MNFLLMLAPGFIPPQFRKAFGAFVLILGLLALLWLGKFLYDRSVIEKHDAKRNEAIAKADKKADNKAAEQRRIDDARAVSEKQEVKEAIDEAKSQGRDPRAAYYECVRLQQSARSRHQPSPNC